MENDRMVELYRRDPSFFRPRRESPVRSTVALRSTFRVGPAYGEG